MDAINDLPVRMSTPPPAYSPPQRCYHMRPGTTQPSAYVPRGHPRAIQIGHPAEKQILFYKPTGIKAQPAPPYDDDDDDERQRHQHRGDDACSWTPPDQQASKLEARIRALEAQLAAQAGK